MGNKGSAPAADSTNFGPDAGGQLLASNCLGLGGSIDVVSKRAPKYLLPFTPPHSPYSPPSNPPPPPSSHPSPTFPPLSSPPTS